MRLPFLAVAVAAALAASGGACTRADRACTEIGCTSTVTVDATPALARYPDTAVVEICVRGRCQSHPASDASEPIVQEDDRLGDLSPSEVVASLLDGSGTLLLRDKLTAAPTRVQPNGEGCPPVCGQVSVVLGADGELVSASAG